MPDYPNTLPLPDTLSYSGEVDVGLIRTDFQTSRANQGINYNSPRTEISMTFAMDNDTYEDDWLPWIKANGFDWFYMPVVGPNAPGTITSTQRVRLISDMQYQKLGDNWLSVTVAAETVPGDFGL